MKFYEVHDEDGCLTKMRNLEAAKQTALAFLTMKSGRKMHIQIYLDSALTPETIRLDSATCTWSDPEPLPFRPAVSSRQDSGMAAAAS